jgi:hypothetical protein
LREAAQSLLDTAALVRRILANFCRFSVGTRIALLVVVTVSTSPRGVHDTLARHRRFAFLGVSIMAQKVVQFIIGQILTDEELRTRFVKRPLETLTELRDAGFELTNSEIEALTQTDRRLWQLGKAWIDPRLQRYPLRRNGGRGD